MKNEWGWVKNMEEPLKEKICCLDKGRDELARGKSMDKILCR